MHTAESVINSQVTMREGFYFRNETPVLHGHARFIDEHTIEVLGESEGENPEIMTADYFVIATGSTPYRPEGVDFDHPRVRDADTILDMDFTPHSITIYGSGVIGCEYASIFKGMGMKVNLVNTHGELLGFLDAEISDALAYHLRDRGVILRNNELFDSVDTFDDHVEVSLKSGKRLKTDVLLWAQGRSGNTQLMGIDKLGLTTNKYGNLEVNENFQTNLDHIYAVGDVVGPPGLASASYDQGRFAASHLLNLTKKRDLIKDIPAGIYTTPAISSLGKTEKQLTEECVPYEVGQAFFKSIARAQITGQTVGMLKILFHRESLAILGIHCFGDQATEIISIGQAIMAQEEYGGNTLEYFVNTTFNYPTMAEAYRVAALNGLNRLC
jgi:NAD(P) transhydrogenase